MAKERFEDALDKLEKIVSKLEDGDILVFAQKVVSKSEGRFRNLAEVTPGKNALNIADQIEKDARLVELILQESCQVLRTRPGTIIVEHRLGFVCANAGIDHSNVAGEGNSHARLELGPWTTPSPKIRRLFRLQTSLRSR